MVGVLGPLGRTVHRFVRSAGQTVRLSELGDGKNSDIDTQGVRAPPLFLAVSCQCRKGEDYVSLALLFEALRFRLAPHRLYLLLHSQLARRSTL